MKARGIRLREEINGPGRFAIRSKAEVVQRELERIEPEEPQRFREREPKHRGKERLFEKRFFEERFIEERFIEELRFEERIVQLA